jgi:hypothetical protein
MSTSGIATIDPKTQGGEVDKLSIPPPLKMVKQVTWLD